MKNLSKLIKIIEYLYELDNKKDELSFQKFKTIIDKWSLGRYSIANDFLLKEKNSKHELKSKIEQLAKELKENLSSEGLTILYKDLEEVILADGVLSDIESEVISIIKKIWKDKLVDINSIITNIFKDNNIIQNNLFALGYLFYTAVKIDGNIDKLELMQVRRNLEAWDNHAARIIIESVNFFEFATSRNNFIDVFYNDYGVPDEEKNKIVNCIKYLRENEVTEVRKIIYEQVMAIIKADSQITDSERWLSSQMRNIWDDI